MTSLRRATAAAYDGLAYRNEASPLVDEFIERKRLAKLGLITTLDTVPALKVDAFLMIDQKLDDLQKRDRSKDQAKNRRKR